MKSLNFLVKRIVLLIDRLFIADVTRKNGIALVRLDAIGDFVIWSHAAKELRSQFPGQKIVLIANKLWVDLAKHLPYWDEVFEIDPGLFKGNLIYRWRTIRKISKKGFETSIQFTHSRTLLGDSIIIATASNNRIASKGDLSNSSAAMKKISDGWYTRLLPVSADSKTDFERNYDFINYLTGFTANPDTHVLPTLVSLPSDILPRRDYCIIFPGASRKERQWPPERFAELINQITIEFEYKCVLCGSADERNLCSSIAEQTNVACINLAGKTSLSEFAELARRSKLIIGNETSAIHIAVAVGTPSVCITGGGHYGRFVPYPENINGIKPLIAVEPMSCFNCNWQCSQPHDPSGPVPCILKIKVRTVMDCAKKIKDSSVPNSVNAISF